MLLDEQFGTFGFVLFRTCFSTFFILFFLVLLFFV